MADYRLEVKPSASKELEKLPETIGIKVLRSVEALASEPRPAQSHKLVASKDSYRLRVGDFRVLYQVDDKAKLVTVYKVGHRKEVYK